MAQILTKRLIESALKGFVQGTIVSFCLVVIGGFSGYECLGLMAAFICWEILRWPVK